MPLLYDAPGCSDGEEGSSDGDGVGNCGAFAVKTDGGRWIFPGSYSIEVGTFNATFQVIGEPVMIATPPPLF